MFGRLFSSRVILLEEGRRCAEHYTTYLLRQVRVQTRPMQQYTISQPLGLLLANEFLPEDKIHHGWEHKVFLHGFVAACEDEILRYKVGGVTMKIRSPYWQLMNGPDHVPNALMRVEVRVECWKIDKFQRVAEPERGGTYPRLVPPGRKGTGT